VRRRGVESASLRCRVVVLWFCGVVASGCRGVGASLPLCLAALPCRCVAAAGVVGCSAVPLYGCCVSAGALVGTFVCQIAPCLFFVCYVIVAALAAASPASAQPKHALFRLVLWRYSHENKVMDCREFHAALVQRQHGVPRTRLPPDRAAPSKRTRPFPLFVL
jgi:hypothetical protein